MSAGQHSADVTALSASLQRVKSSMGAERFAAAQKALQTQQQGRGGSTGSSANAAPVAPLAASQADDTADTLALVRAAGIRRFGQ
jgi:hypothetical protein